MARRPSRPTLTADQKADADRLHAAFLAAAADDLRLLAETLAATTDETLFGANEFAVRDLAHALAAKALEVTLADREKKAPPAAASVAPPVPRPPSTNGGKGVPPSPSSARSA